MENFFYCDNFYSDISDLMDELEIDEDNVNDLPGDWEVEVEDTTKEKIFVFEKQSVSDAIIETTDRWEERFPEESESTFKQIESAIKAGIDIDKINELLPSLYYANGEMSIITKDDLIGWCK